METECVEIPSVLPPYMPPRKLSAKPINDPKDAKFGMFTPLYDEVLGKIRQLRMENWDFNDRSKYPQFELSRYLQ